MITTLELSEHSVSVAKYIKAPTTDAKRLEKTLLPPTRELIHSEGIIPGMFVVVSRP
jgi:hypothetical protein